ncbi:hypothetical protein PABG_06298 [Paracoccidioides brasiliensis Pb03]|nr:hypothetical protein PABG_06298 [Paracoccidioides brasiliensis Pb03]
MSSIFIQRTTVPNSSSVTSKLGKFFHVVPELLTTILSTPYFAFASPCMHAQLRFSKDSIVTTQSVFHFHILNDPFSSISCNVFKGDIGTFKRRPGDSFSKPRCSAVTMATLPSRLPPGRVYARRGQGFAL